MSATATKEISDWLEKLGMSEYTQRFAEQHIDIEVLRELTDADFDRLGVSIGHRRKLVKALAAGVPASADTRLNEALTEARELKHPLTLVVALNEAAVFEYTFGSPDRARRYAKEQAAFASEQGFPYWAATADTYRGHSLCALGDLVEGLDLITKGLSMYRATGAQIAVSPCLAEQAAAYGALDRPLEGMNCLDEAVKMIDTNNERYWEAEVYRVRGDLLLLDPKPDIAKAEAYFNRGPRYCS